MFDRLTLSCAPTIVHRCLLLAAVAVSARAAATPAPDRPDSAASGENIAVAAGAPSGSRWPQYRPLAEALSRWRVLDGSAWRDSLARAPRVDPGDRYSGLADVAQRLRVLGDLPAAADSATVDSLYGEPLLSAVRRFQERHGLASDGVIGRATFGQLDISPAGRARQIELSLARLDRLPEPPDGPAVVVNIPAFRLYGFATAARDTAPSLEMGVIVGKAATPTPVFADTMRYVILRPFWHPPRSIITGEILPAIEQDPGYLDAHEMELCPSANDLVPALPFTPENLERLRAGTARVRQRPGPRNTLGLAKFLFPNRHTVYLHGASKYALFARTRRDFSHGCVRVEDPAALAEFVLAGEPGWTRQRIAGAMEGEKSTRVDLTHTLPVIITYLTAWPRGDGVVVFCEDLYGLDAAETLPAPPAAGATLISTP
jgi:murein L,D-transpeptidase YcbB/YkuD